ncbi:molybdopterin-dependent oxidoreductase [Rhodoferax sp.]|uniref:molybdopterin-dependent oxidoreductase n=1 Tax=Rhodoferax sp. TaxID=50421 RepID=UPI00284FB50F|nr:molybdopterin-dependent oxidoreductase [Rhodoferax sp.]MDR3371831.1 molybdopterin-dependent oxidoreductase [Rhodoferax sp.]
MTEASHHRICPLCEACCGLEITVKDGRVAQVRGDAQDPFSLGYICPKAVALKDLHNDPDRLRTPLIKRNGQHVEVTWDEAFAEIARRLQPLQAEHSRHAVAVAVGNPTAHKYGLMTYFPRLARALGTRNVFSASSLDQIPKQLACGLMFGHWMTVPLPDISRAQLLIVLGANPLASNGSMWTVPDFKGKARALQARGGRLVVIDPRRTETAAVADAYHAIRPGADVFLLAAMVNTLLAQGWVRLGAIEDWVQGVAEVQQAVAAFTPLAVAGRVGMTAHTIVSLTRELAHTERAALYARIGTCTQSFGTLASWLVEVLNVLTGHLDTPGGVMFAKAPAFASNTLGKGGSGRGISTGRHHARVSGAPEVMGELPITCLAEEIETSGTDQVRALITAATNPVLSAPNGQRLARALASLDFMVSIDIYLNETTRHADVILPGLSPLQDDHYDLNFAQLSWRNNARYSAPVLPPDERPAEWQILLKLAAIAQGQAPDVDVNALDDAQFEQDLQRLFGPHASAVQATCQGLSGPQRLLEVALRSGPYGDAFGQKPDGLTLAKVMAANGGLDLGELQPRIPEVLRTPSGKVELAPPMLLADMARAAADLGQPVPELVVIGRRDLRSNNSWMHNLPTLAKGPYRCTALVHPTDAARLKLTDSALAQMHSEVGSIEVQVEISADMMPGVVSLPHGWGHDLPGARLSLAAQRPGVNLNALLSDQARDPLSGNAVLSGVAIRMTALGA